LENQHGANLGTTKKAGGSGENAVRKTLGESLSSSFLEIPERTVDAEVEWQLFKAAAASSAAQVCGYSVWQIMAKK